MQESKNVEIGYYQCRDVDEGKQEFGSRKARNEEG